ncbi:MAG: cell division protein ZapE [Azospirillaceae bacterium]|nr:cell division protein ZapE [Azospirillaceae bacterium]
MPNGPLSLYRARCAAGALKPDDAQELAVEKLQSLHNALANYRPQTGAEGWRARFGLSRRPAEPVPAGLFIYGDVGRGKSMLMDLFFETAPVAKRRRVHFHAFLLEIQQRLHQERTRDKAGAADVLIEIAKAIAAETWLLCFDEFHVVDIGDAMILGRLFTALFDRGVVVVATSNWPPDDLYKDGLNRALFLPFIALLKERLDILHLAGPLDYRLQQLRREDVYHQPLGAATEQRVTAIFQRLCGSRVVAPCRLSAQGRAVLVPRAAGTVGWVEFDAMCAQPLGAADYLTIACHFEALVIDRVPRLRADQRNEAKRFIVLIDELYEHKVQVIIAADCPPDQIYAEGPHAFEFHRTVSRLMEMQSEEYRALVHLT